MVKQTDAKVKLTNAFLGQVYRKYGFIGLFVVFLFGTGIGVTTLPPWFSQASKAFLNSNATVDKLELISKEVSGFRLSVDKFNDTLNHVLEDNSQIIRNNEQLTFNIQSLIKESEELRKTALFKEDFMWVINYCNQKGIIIPEMDKVLLERILSIKDEYHSK